MSNHFLHLDTETTGLDVERHHIWEIGYAIDDEEVQSAVVNHNLEAADDAALEIGNYWQRMYTEPFSAHEGIVWEGEMRKRLAAHEGTLYLVGANPDFDARFLQRRWGVTPWHYRTLDIESYAIGAISPLTDGEPVPQGLFNTTQFLNTLGWNIPEPDHTAGGDVTTSRAVFRALTLIYAGETP